MATKEWNAKYNPGVKTMEEHLETDTLAELEEWLVKLKHGRMCAERSDNFYYTNGGATRSNALMALVVNRIKELS